jgi:hypothetical protein
VEKGSALAVEKSLAAASSAVVAANDRRRVRVVSASSESVMASSLVNWENCGSCQAAKEDPSYPVVATFHGKAAGRSTMGRCCIPVEILE